MAAFIPQQRFLETISLVTGGATGIGPVWPARDSPAEEM